MDLPEGVNTLPVPDGLELEYLQNYTYVCEHGHSTDDVVNILCLPDGTLSLDEGPVCTRKSIVFKNHIWIE